MLMGDPKMQAAIEVGLGLRFAAPDEFLGEQGGSSKVGGGQLAGRRRAPAPWRRLGWRWHRGSAPRVMQCQHRALLQCRRRRRRHRVR
jgi:hypothetical protein